jgi:hypothetical protein
MTLFATFRQRQLPWLRVRMLFLVGLFLAAAASPAQAAISATRAKRSTFSDRLAVRRPESAPSRHTVMTH